jgi:ATP-dependent Clp protease protease subunit
MAIYDTMQYVRPDVSTVCMGQAAAASAVLLAAGAPGKRLMLPHAKVLLHQPSTGGQGSLSDLSLQAQEIVRVRTEVEQVLSFHTGQSVDRLRIDTDRDKVFRADEAIAYGLVDAVITSAVAEPTPRAPALTR